MKKIWIINHYANTTYFDEGGRHYSFAKYLKQHDYEPVIFCSNAEHGTGNLYFENLKLWEEHVETKINVPYVFIKGRPYIGNGKNRIFCMVDFYKNLKKVADEYFKKNGSPDIIIASSVHPLAVLAGEQLAKKYKIKCIAEIRDLWPESIIALGIASNYNPVMILLRALEKKLYKDADKIIFTIEGGYDYIKERHWDKIIPREKVYHINNGVDREIYLKNIHDNKLDDDDLKNDRIFKVVYTGSIRQANGLYELVECANILKSNEKIKFLIYGSGDYREELQKRIRENNLSNVILKGAVKKNQIPYVLSKSNLNLLNYNAAAATAGLYRFGSSQNKLFEYFASGKPIISNYKPGYDLIGKYMCGISKNMLDGNEYATALKEIVESSSNKYNTMCKNSLRAGADYDFKNLTQKLINIIEIT